MGYAGNRFAFDNSVDALLDTYWCLMIGFSFFLFFLVLLIFIFWALAGCCCGLGGYSVIPHRNAKWSDSSPGELNCF